MVKIQIWHNFECGSHTSRSVHTLTKDCTHLASSTGDLDTRLIADGSESCKINILAAVVDCRVKSIINKKINVHLIRSLESRTCFLTDSEYYQKHITPCFLYYLPVLWVVSWWQRNSVIVNHVQTCILQRNKRNKQKKKFNVNY